MRTNVLLPLAISLASTTAVHADTSDSPPAAASTPASRWITVAAMSEARRYDGARGIRAEVDVADLNGWILGGAASLSRAVVGIYDGGMTAELHTRDLKAIGYVARAARFERWELRGALGLGAIRTTASGDMIDRGTMQPVESHGTFPTAEASLRATLPISPRWAVTGGSIASYYGQTFAFANGTTAGETHREAELVFLLGLAYRR